MSTPKYKKEARQAAQKAISNRVRYEKQYSIKRERKYTKEFKEYVPEASTRRETTHYPSLESKSNGSTAKKESIRYTGDYLIGIATMHKSNLVPVGRDTSPSDFSTMRRN